MVPGSRRSCFKARRFGELDYLSLHNDTHWVLVQFVQLQLQFTTCTRSRVASFEVDTPHLRSSRRERSRFDMCSEHMVTRRAPSSSLDSLPLSCRQRETERRSEMNTSKVGLNRSQLHSFIYVLGKIHRLRRRSERIKKRPSSSGRGELVEV